MQRGLRLDSCWIRRESWLIATNFVELRAMAMGGGGAPACCSAGSREGERETRETAEVVPPRLRLPNARACPEPPAAPSARAAPDLGFLCRKSRRGEQLTGQRREPARRVAVRGAAAPRRSRGGAAVGGDGENWQHRRAAQGTTCACSCAHPSRREIHIGLTCGGLIAFLFFNSGVSM